jgi:hypothetical protein
MNVRFSRLTALILFATTGALAACQSPSQGPGLSPDASALDVSHARLKTARNVVCAHAKTSDQTVKLPSTAGIFGTMSFKAFSPKASGCDYVKISTGGDIEKAKVIAQFAHLAGIDPNAAASPLLTISVGEAFNADPVFDKSSIISGMQLKTSANLNFPDGTYYATITTTKKGTITYTGVIVLIAKNGVLTVAPPAKFPPDGRKFPLVFIANSSSIITLYPRGVVPPPPTASPTPTPKGSPTPTPFPIPTGAPGFYGNPPPPVGALIGQVSYEYPEPPCTGVPYPCEASGIPIYQENGAALIVHLAYGTVAYDAGSIAYMGLKSYTDDCPKDWTVNAGLNGTGEIIIPKNDPWVGQNCTITMSTIPKGKDGSGYEEDIYLFAFGLRQKHQ